MKSFLHVIIPIILTRFKTFLCSYFSKETKAFAFNLNYCQLGKIIKFSLCPTYRLAFWIGFSSLRKSFKSRYKCLHNRNSHIIQVLSCQGTLLLDIIKNDSSMHIDNQAVQKTFSVTLKYDKLILAICTSFWLLAY